jgi:hypothetical protein
MDSDHDTSSCKRGWFEESAMMKLKILIKNAYRKLFSHEKHPFMPKTLAR